MKKISYILAAAAAALCAFTTSAQPAAIQHTTADGRQVSVTAITPYILRIDNSVGAAAGVQSVLALEADPSAAAVSPSGTLTTSAGVSATIDDNGSLTLSSGHPGTTVYDSGARRQSDGKTTISIATSGKGSFYGAGERGHSLRLNGDTLVMYNRQNYGYTGSDPRIKQMNITMPLVLSSDGYALVFDDYAAAQMVLSNPVVYTTESRKPVSYYYVGGTDNMAELTEALTELTGRQPLPPLWALGYITSKYGYRTQDETEGIVDTLKAEGYPLDGIVLDLYWYGKEQDMGRLEWDPQQWPQPQQMMKRLKERGVNLIPISQPYVLRNGRALDNYNTLAAKGMFVADSTGGPQEVKIWVGEGGMFDVSNPDTRRWLTERYAKLTDMGAGGWWGDLGEPEVHPLSGIHANGLTASEYHNMYGNDWSRIISELYAERYPDRRLMTLMRGGTTGLQRYSVFPWSTDVSRSWGGLEPQIRIMLNSGLSGLGYMSSDLGGFAVDEKTPYLPELYVRWVQAGLFSPVFRTHAQQYAEPVRYPQHAEILLNIVRERYRWLPYNYTLAYENARYGYPLVRPLDFRATDADGSYDNISDQYLWGDNVLVAPVITEGARSRSIIFPEGSEWVDYSHPTRVYAGGTTLTDYPAPLDKLPLFIRQGAFIPTADYKMENTGDYRADRFDMAWYASDGESSYTLYDDNHLSPKALVDKQYRLLHFTGRRNGRDATITVSAEGHYQGAPADISINWTVYGYSSAPRSVKADGRKADFSYNTEDGSVTFTTTVNAARGTEITIK